MTVDHRFASEEPRHPIQVVSRRTGLTPDVIRAWERRHSAVEPERSRTRRRLYSDADVERLVLLRRATLLGRRIGDVAHLPTGSLRALVQADDSASARAPHAERLRVEDTPVAQIHLDACRDALRSLDTPRLESGLQAAALALATSGLIEKVLAPLMRRVGDAWREGSLGVGHEHLATVLVRALLSSLRAAHATPGAGPELIATTPAGQRHELGALMAAVIATSHGWKVSYLGADVPAESIAEVASARRARVVALSLVYPVNDSGVEGELLRLRRLLPASTSILVGGPAAADYDRALRQIGAARASDMSSLGVELGKLS